MPSTLLSCASLVVGKMKTVVAYTKLSANYTFADVAKRPRNFCIGFWSVFTVVFFVGLILSGLSKTPVVFLRFAELSTGEMDVLVLAEGSLPVVNYTEMRPLIDAAPSIEGSTPRWLLKGEVEELSPSSENTSLRMATNVIIVDSAKEKQIGVGRAWPYRQIGYGESQVYHSALRFIKTEANVGQRLKLVIDIAGILQQQGVNVNLGAFSNNASEINGTNIPLNLTALSPFLNGTDLGVVDIPLQNVTAAIPGFDVQGVESQLFTQFLTPQLKLTAATAIEETYAKYPAALGNVAILDFHELVTLFFDQACYTTLRQPLATLAGPTSPTLPIPSQEELLGNFSLEDYTLVVVAMFSDRYGAYYSNREERTRELIRKSDALFLSIGVDFAGSVQYPVESALQGFYFFQLFLGSLFQAVAVIIAVLGALLVYTLLLTNSEERSFEVAIMRSQGMLRSQLAHLLVFQSVVFIAPAVVIAMCILLAVNAIIEVAISGFSAVPADTSRINNASIVIPILFGVCVPILANWGPTKHALLSSLRDALDVYRQSANETKVTAMRLAELGLEPWQTMLGWFLVIVGFTVYYVIPYSFIFDQLWLFFLILNGILLGMLFGLCLISYSFEGWIQRGALFLILWGPDRKLKTLILRNLGSHRERNSKAYMMFTVSVACIIFGGVLFTLLSRSISQSVQSAIGAEVAVQSLSFDFPLNRSSIESFLRSQNGTVRSFAFATFTLRSFPQISASPEISNMIGFPRRGHRIVGVDEQFLDAVYPEFVLYASRDSAYAYNQTTTGIANVVQSMFVEPSSANLRATSPVFTGYPPNTTVPDVQVKYQVLIPTIMGSAATEVLGLTPGSLGSLRFSYRTGDGVDARSRETVFLFQPRALVDKFPGWPLISSLSLTFGISTMIIPTREFKLLLEANRIDFPRDYQSPNYKLPAEAEPDLLYEKVFIRMNPGLSKTQLEDFVNLLQSKVNPYYHIPFNTADIVAQLQSTADLIIYFFFFISGVAIILDTFMLWLAFVSNVKLNAWGFAVLRSLGFTVGQLIRSYIYEALCIVLASFFVGTIIGVVIAFTLIVQMNLFLQLPVAFDFPVPLFVFLLGLSLVSAVLGSYIPTRSITKKSIASVLKSGD